MIDLEHNMKKIKKLFKHNCVRNKEVVLAHYFKEGFIKEYSCEKCGKRWTINFKFKNNFKWEA